MRNKDATRPVLPRLRFPEFRDAGEWERTCLGDEKVASRVKERIPLEELTLENYVNTESMLPDYAGVTTSSKLPLAGSFTRFAIGDVLVSNIRPYLKKVWSASVSGGASNDVIVVRAASKLSDSFLAHLLKNDTFIGYVMEGARGVKMPRGDISKLFQYPVAVPASAEQQKIADCLGSLDQLITLEAQQLTALKTHKHVLMQQLFPAAGGTLPTMRFPEFRNSGEWEATKLIDAVTPVIREVQKPKSSYLALGLRSHGKGTFHKPHQAPEKNSMDKLYLVHHDDLIVNITFAWEGAIAIASEADHGSYVSHRFPTYQCKDSRLRSGFLRYLVIDPKFVYSLGLISPGGAGRNRVMNKAEFLRLTVLLPDTEEQRRIADCLESLDNLISLEAEKLAALKTFKRGLMQQLFPVLDEVTE